MELTTSFLVGLRQVRGLPIHATSLRTQEVDYNTIVGHELGMIYFYRAKVFEVCEGLKDCHEAWALRDVSLEYMERFDGAVDLGEIVPCFTEAIMRQRQRRQRGRLAIAPDLQDIHEDLELTFEVAEPEVEAAFDEFQQSLAAGQSDDVEANDFDSDDDLVEVIESANNGIAMETTRLTQSEVLTSCSEPELEQMMASTKLRSASR